MEGMDIEPEPSSPGQAPSPPQTPATTDPLQQSPRKRRPPVASRLPGINTELPSKLSIADIKTELQSRLKLKYTPDDWQAHLILRLLQGYDSILVAGTGYGKSLIFEGLAVLGGYKVGRGRKPLVILICPLKALEHDQAQQAAAKGLKSLVINEDTTRTRGVWDAARRTVEMLYISPEMALSDSFVRLWQDISFRRRVVAVVVDEAHCVDEWGGVEFRPEYQKLDVLRHYTGQTAPFFACTATCSTPTFDALWKILKFGQRPFWGLDVGVDRPNLLYDIRPLTNTKAPILDILNFFPKTLSSITDAAQLPKCIFYFKSEQDCGRAVDYLRKCLPNDIRKAVQPFTSTALCEEGKQKCWRHFTKGKVRVICATDAAGMGCNVADIQYIASFGIPTSVGQVSQRWGRAGRDRVTQAVCVLLVPPWAFRPEAPPTLLPQLARVQGSGGRRQPWEDTKENIIKRAKLGYKIEDIVNLKHDRPRGCVHRAFNAIFRPATRLNVYLSLTANTYHVEGKRSQESRHELSWTVLDLERSPPLGRCCHVCNPDMVEEYGSTSNHDSRLHAFAHEVLVPIRPPSRATTTVPRQVSKSDRKDLEEKLVKWRDDEHERRGSSLMLGPEIFLPPKQLKLLSSEEVALKLASVATVDGALVHKLVPLELIQPSQRESLATVIDGWVNTLLSQPPVSHRTPTADKHSDKRARNDNTSTSAPRNVSPSPGSHNLPLVLSLGSTESRIPVPSTPAPRTSTVSFGSTSYYRDMMQAPRQVTLGVNAAYYKPRTFHQSHSPSSPSVSAGTPVIPSSTPSGPSSTPRLVPTTPLLHSPNPYALLTPSLIPRYTGHRAPVDPTPLAQPSFIPRPS